MSLHNFLIEKMKQITALEYKSIFQNHHYGFSCHMEQHLLCVFFCLWLFNIIPEVGAILLSTHQLNKYRKFFIYCEIQFAFDMGSLSELIKDIRK